MKIASLVFYHIDLWQWLYLLSWGSPSLFQRMFLTFKPPNYSIWIFTHLKLCLADAIHNFKWVKIIPIWKNGGQLFSNIAINLLMSYFIFNMFKTWYSYVLIKKENPYICDTGG